MQVKGTGIKTTKEFVKTFFADDYDKWVNSLPNESKKLYEGLTDVSQWYPIRAAYLQPVQRIAEMFFDNDLVKCGEELGQYSANVALKGVYKVFLLIASPNYLMKRAPKIISTFYTPSNVVISESTNKSVTLEVTKFDEIDEALEYRIAGWCKRALELAHCRGVEYKLVQSLAKGDDKTTIIFNWN